MGRTFSALSLEEYSYRGVNSQKGLIIRFPFKSLGKVREEVTKKKGGEVTIIASSKTDSGSRIGSGGKNLLKGGGA